ARLDRTAGQAPFPAPGLAPAADEQHLVTTEGHDGGASYGSHHSSIIECVGCTDACGSIMECVGCTDACGSATAALQERQERRRTLPHSGQPSSFLPGKNLCTRLSSGVYLPRPPGSAG